MNGQVSKFSQKSRNVTPLLPSLTLKMVPLNALGLSDVLVRVGEGDTIGRSRAGRR